MSDVIEFPDREATGSAVGIDSVNVCRTAKITYRQLDFWTRAGYLKSLPGPSGSGNSRKYSSKMVAKAQNMSVLTKIGISAAKASQYADKAEPTQRGFSYTEWADEQVVFIVAWSVP